VPEEAKLRMIAISTARELVEDRIIEPLIAEAIAKIREEHAAEIDAALEAWCGIFGRRCSSDAIGS
jgi:hypothetical protein